MKEGKKMHQFKNKAINELIKCIKELNNNIIILIKKISSNECDKSINYDPDEYLERDFTIEEFHQPIDIKIKKSLDEAECFYELEDSLGIPKGEEDIW